MNTLDDYSFISIPVIDQLPSTSENYMAVNNFIRKLGRIFVGVIAGCIGFYIYLIYFHHQDTGGKSPWVTEESLAALNEYAACRGLHQKIISQFESIFNQIDLRGFRASKLQSCVFTNSGTMNAQYSTISKDSANYTAALRYEDDKTCVIGITWWLPNGDSKTKMVEQDGVCVKWRQDE